jgi:flagellar biosynthetic protein FlhB
MAESGKTEKATPKKKEDERKKGNIFQSTDITNALSVLGLFFFIRISASFFFEYMEKQIADSLTSFEQIPDLTQRTASYYIGNFSLNTLLMILPVGIVASLIAVILTAAQTRLFINFSPLKPKFSRMNPLSGLKKIFTLRSLVNLIKSILFHQSATQY